MSRANTLSSSGVQRVEVEKKIVDVIYEQACMNSCLHTYTIFTSDQHIHTRNW